MRKEYAAVVVLLLMAGLGEAKVSPSNMVSPKNALKVAAVNQAAGQTAAAYTAIKEASVDENETVVDITPPPLPGEEDDIGRTQTQAAVQQARRVQWMLAKQGIQDTGYEGQVSELAVAFNNMTKHLNADFRESIINGSDEGLTRNVAYSVANRELARMREEQISELNGSDESDEVILGLADASGGQTLRNRIRVMDPKFKRKLAYIAVNGTQQEKQKLGERLNDYAEQENRARGMALYTRIIANRLNHTLIRIMLSGNSELRELIDSQP